MKSNKSENPSGHGPQDVEELGTLLPVATKAFFVFLIIAIVAGFGMVSFDQGSLNDTHVFLEAVSNIVLVISVTIVIAVFVSIFLILRVSSDSEQKPLSKSKGHPQHTTKTTTAEPGMRVRLSKAMAALAAKSLLVCLAGSGVCLVLIGLLETPFSLNETSEIWSDVYSAAVFLCSGVVVAVAGLLVFLWEMRVSTSPSAPGEQPEPGETF